MVDSPSQIDKRSPRHSSSALEQVLNEQEPENLPRGLIAQRPANRGDYFVSDIGTAANRPNEQDSFKAFAPIDNRTDQDRQENRPTIATGQLEDNDESVPGDGNPEFVLIASDYLPSQKGPYAPSKPSIASGIDLNEKLEIDFDAQDDNARSLISADVDTCLDQELPARRL